MNPDVKSSLRITVITLGWLMVACGDPLAPPDTLYLDRTSAYAAPGDTLVVQAKLVTGARDTIDAVLLRWQSSDTGVVRVTTAGRVVAVNPGVATLTATSGDASAAVQINVVQRFTHVKVAELSSCALKLNGRAFCWGANSFGQLGSPAPEFGNRPLAVAGDRVFTQLSSGSRSSCALDQAGLAYCWGSDNSGQLGLGGPERSLFSGTRIRDVPTPVVNDLRFRSISVGAQHACGLTTDGATYCWGSAEAGRLGIGRSGGFAVPTPTALFALSPQFDQVQAGASTCGLSRDGRPYCWGFLWDRGFWAYPQEIQTPLRFKTIAMGAAHACALTQENQVYCWGSNFQNQLGNISVAASTSVPVAVSGNLRFGWLFAGDATTCGITAETHLYCWGSLPDTANIRREPAPVRIPTPEPFSMVAVKEGHICGVAVRGVVYCMGQGSAGQLGVGELDFSAEFIRIRDPEILQ
jgi:alpha-tubulin suppressor-like RCC1 family protein